MDVQNKLDEIVAAVEGARSMPMSASCVINRADLLALLTEVRGALPESLAEARAMLGDREQVVAEAQAEAERIIESAHQHRGSLVSDTEVARRSQEEADRILTEARREAEEIRVEADDYVDSKLANFEVVLTKTIGSVDRGREKLLGRDPGEDGYGYDDDEPPERTADPAELRRRADAYVDTKLGAFEAVLAKTLEAVGRGRQKLTGHRAVDELAAHMAAQDLADGGPARQTDDEFLAHLSGAVPLPAPAAAPQPVPQEVPVADGYGYGQQQPEYAPAAAQGYPAQEPAAVYAQDPYQRQPQPGYDAYGYPQQQPEYTDPQQQPEYADPAAYTWQQQGGYEQQAMVPHQQHYAQQPQPAGLDETSFFDTSMLDLDALRQLEQGH
ncbi:ATP synthase F0 subunit B [Streptantibioticus silvisoli]|uniref:Cell division initiation protein n=1 Tax=Streptantibioticus silvisoli TaxID=2705255 RepID=A0ABT6W967_9ACTN|nr:cell division initiation protein [Streptantibioticus silvisoli]MDI5966910.1 cell division initiation protein [Streptantibioticus silvisoli]